MTIRESIAIAVLLVIVIVGVLRFIEPPAARLQFVPVHVQTKP